MSNHLLPQDKLRESSKFLPPSYGQKCDRKKKSTHLTKQIFGKDVGYTDE